VQFGFGAVLRHSITPRGGFEDEDDDEDSGSTELAEVLPDEASGLQASSSDR
jgi:hypothetical protein